MVFVIFPLTAKLSRLALQWWFLYGAGSIVTFARYSACAIAWHKMETTSGCSSKSSADGRYSAATEISLLYRCWRYRG